MAISRLGLAGAWGQLKQIRFSQVIDIIKAQSFITLF